MSSLLAATRAPARDAPAPNASAPDAPALDAPARPHNVPAALSSFVGRAREVASVRAALAGARLLTLTGPGGAGKTRLAREVGAVLAEHGTDYPDGLWWVELAPLAEGDDIAGAIAGVLGVHLASDTASAAGIADALRGRRVLLVLDNCEHVIGAAAALADTLLRACPQLGILATSREALAVEGEVAWVVPPLAHPPRARGGDPLAAPLGPTAADVGAYDAVRLFVERARAAQPAFALTDRNAEAVAAICARLDGVPLALELAAAHVGTFGVEQLATRLDDALAVLTRGRRAGPARHQTLRALLDWGYALLAPAEQRLLDRLSVFRDAATLDAVVAVCGDGAPGVGAVGEGGAGAGAGVLAALGRLVEQSLVDVRDVEGEVRYGLLETVRQYGAARLAAAPDRRAALRDRHLAWAAGLVADVDPLLWSPHWIEAGRRFTPVIDDLRAAVHWSTEAADPSPEGRARAERALAIVGPMLWYWVVAGGWDDAQRMLDAAFAAAVAAGLVTTDGPSRWTAAPELTRDARRALGVALQCWMSFAVLQNRVDDALRAAHGALALWEAHGATADPHPVAARMQWYSRLVAAESLLLSGDVPAALRLSEESTRGALASGDPRAVAYALMRRGFVLAAVGERDEGARLLEDAAGRWRAQGDRWFLMLTFQSLAECALAAGEVRRAAAYVGECAELQRDTAVVPWLLVRTLMLAAATRTGDGARAADDAVEDAAAAARLLGAAERLRVQSGTYLLEYDRAVHDRAAAAAAAVLGPSAFADAWAGGAGMTPAEAVETARAVPRLDRPRGTPPPAPADALGTAAARPGPLALRILGPLAVSRDGVSAADAPPAGKVAELLLWLALHAAGTKEQIGLDLWPEASPARLRSNFHFTLHHLRRALGDRGWVVQENGRYRLVRALATRAGAAVSLDCDADDLFATADALRAAARTRAPLDDAALAAARQVLARCAGELAEGLTVGDWIEGHRARAGAAWDDGMAVVAHALAAAGRYAEALAAYEGVLARDPTREAAHRAVMACHAAAGEPARALAHYDALVARLARELGTRPARETQALAERLRAG